MSVDPNAQGEGCQAHWMSVCYVDVSVYGHQLDTRWMCMCERHGNDIKLIQVHENNRKAGKVKRQGDSLLFATKE